MSLRLILTRHAKSSWGDDSLDDHARPLNGRGRRSAANLGHWLQLQGYLPDRVLSSDSVRTCETWERLSAPLSASPQLTLAPALYLAPAQTILEHVQRVQDSGVLMILAHNPGIAVAANEFAREPSPHPQFSQYPTGATTVFDFAADTWQSVDWRQGEVVAFVVPREIEAG